MFFLIIVCHSHLFALALAYYEIRTIRIRNFYSTDPRAQCYKTFYVRGLRMFVISLRVCRWQAFQA
jgi:hypothetical protein